MMVTGIVEITPFQGVSPLPPSPPPRVLDHHRFQELLDTFAAQLTPFATVTLGETKRPGKVEIDTHDTKLKFSIKHAL